MKKPAPPFLRQLRKVLLQSRFHSWGDGLNSRVTSSDTAQKMKFFIKDFFSNDYQIRRKLENFIFL